MACTGSCMLLHASACCCYLLLLFHQRGSMGMHGAVICSHDHLTSVEFIRYNLSHFASQSGWIQSQKHASSIRNHQKISEITAIHLYSLYNTVYPKNAKIILFVVYVSITEQYWAYVSCSKLFPSIVWHYIVISRYTLLYCFFMAFLLFHQWEGVMRCQLDVMCSWKLSKWQPS